MIASRPPTIDDARARLGVGGVAVTGAPQESGGLRRNAR